MNFPSKENMMDCFKNRSFLWDGNGFSDCVFTQSVQNGCQNKENYRMTSPQTQLISWEQLVSYQPSSDRENIAPIAPAINKYVHFGELEEKVNFPLKFKYFYRKKLTFFRMLIKVKVIMINCVFLKLFSLF